MALSLVLSFFLLWSLVISTSTAFDITKILNQYPEYAAFNEELSKTRVADEINMRKSVTVLVIANGPMSRVTDQKESSIVDIMRIHILLDYYDSAKIKTLTDETTLTTLYQTTGSADKKQGFIIATKDNNEIKLDSAMCGSQMSAKINKVVTSIPYDVSVIQISSPIIPSDKDASDASSKSTLSQDLHHSSSTNPSDSPADSSSENSANDIPAHPPLPSNVDDADAKADESDVDPGNLDKDAHTDDGKPRPLPSSSRKTLVSGVMLLASFVATL